VDLPSVGFCHLAWGTEVFHEALGKVPNPGDVREGSEIEIQHVLDHNWHGDWLRVEAVM
jgi:hypothetical protein